RRLARSSSCQARAHPADRVAACYDQGPMARWVLGSRNPGMITQYVLLLLTVVLGAIAGGVAIGCRTIRDWSWMVVLGVLIFLGAAALFSVVNPRVPGNIPSRSSLTPAPPDAESPVVRA